MVSRSLILGAENSGEKTINMQSPAIETDDSDYRVEETRLKSYANWPLRYMDSAKMAAAGFYYTGKDDRVRCFECKIELYNWLDGDDPMKDHKRWRGGCRFVRKIPCSNVPLGVDPASIPKERNRTSDVCGPYAVEYESCATADCHIESHLPGAEEFGSLGIGRSKDPVHPKFASYDARVRSFESWPKLMSQTKESLADAGFYYTGKDDQTLCYHCGGGLKDWEIDDDPWEQHAVWFSKCQHLLNVKGHIYVNTVTRQAVQSKEVIVCSF